MATGEHVCRRCGRCCEYKTLVVDNDTMKLRMVRSGVQCECWDEGSKLCLVYPDRFTKHPGCLTMGEGIAQHLIPADCPYVADIEDYRCVVEDFDPLEKDD